MSRVQIVIVAGAVMALAFALATNIYSGRREDAIRAVAEAEVSPLERPLERGDLRLRNGTNRVLPSSRVDISRKSERERHHRSRNDHDLYSAHWNPLLFKW